MSSLQYLAGDGRLLYVDDSGDIGLARECCCASTPCDCDPPLETTYDVTVSGFTGDFAPRYNGTYTIDFVSYCTWSGGFGSFGLNNDVDILLDWQGGLSEWSCQFSIQDYTCNYLMYLTSADPCVTDPTGTYSQKNRTGVCGSKTPATLTLLIA